ncbi:MAG TPA: PDZ domain-containing protein [Firmicutes bacterium]|nr:PDZ domain-containing protein [Bacillota bacterium]
MRRSVPARVKRQVLFFALLAVILGASAQSFLYRYYLVLMPGLTLDLSKIVTVEEGIKDSAGKFLLTSVSSQPATPISLIYAAFSPATDIVPKSQEIPPGIDMERYLRIMKNLMEESQMIAQAVALKRLGYSVKMEAQVKVEDLLPGSPAKDKVMAGDIILAVDAKRVRTAQEAIDIIQDRKVGQDVMLTLVREGRVITTRVATIPRREDRMKAAIGVLISPYIKYEFPVKIKMDALDIRGSSAGIMFCLEVLDQLTARDLTKGHVIAGTGTLDIDGRVGPIAGVRQKVKAAERAGAEYFLVPRQNSAEAREAGARIKIVPIGSLDDALKFLDEIPGRKTRGDGESM